MLEDEACFPHLNIQWVDVQNITVRPNKYLTFASVKEFKFLNFKKKNLKESYKQAIMVFTEVQQIYVAIDVTGVLKINGETCKNYKCLGFYVKLENQA